MGTSRLAAPKRFEREVPPLDPALVVILIGANDLAHHKPTELILRSIEQMASSARKHNISVFICSILPARGDAARIRPRSEIESLNSSLQELALAHGATYVDLNSELRNDHGEFAEAFSDDGLHPNAAGYLDMTNALLPRLLPYYSGGQSKTQSSTDAKVAGIATGPAG